MNREQVIELMREAGAGYEHPRPNDYAGIVDVFVKFAALVAAAEREACAELCAKAADNCMSDGNGDGEYIAMYLRDYIVARGQNKETK